VRYLPIDNNVTRDYKMMHVTAHDTIMEYELPHAFEPITKYFDHRYFRAPRDVLSFLRDTDPDAGLVLATLENDMVGFEAYIRAGASVDAQIV